MQHHERRTSSTPGVLDDFIHQFDALRVEVVVRLIKQEQAWRSKNEASESQPSLHARRKTPHPFVVDVTQPDTFERRANPVFAHAQHARGEDEVLGRSEVVVEAGGVGKEPDVPPDFDRVLYQVVSENPPFTGGWSQRRRNHPQ